MSFSQPKVATTTSDTAMLRIIANIPVNQRGNELRKGSTLVYRFILSRCHPQIIPSASNGSLAISVSERLGTLTYTGQRRLKPNASVDPTEPVQSYGIAGPLHHLSIVHGRNVCN